MSETSVEMKAKKRLKDTLLLHQKNYTAFIEDTLRVTTLEEYQRRVLKTVQENERTAVSACHDVGKTFLAARIAIAFLMTNPNSKVITTAPTYNQVKRILWSELRGAVAMSKIPLGGKLNETDWTITPEWFAIGFTPKNEVTGGEGQGTQSSFQGFHAQGGLLLVFDEATGIPIPTWVMAEGLLTQQNVKFLAIGNPTSKQSEFYRCFQSPSWAKVYLNCFDSPNLKANNINNLADLEREIAKVSSLSDADAMNYLSSYKVTKPYLLTAKWVVENARKWGLDHPLTVSKILGRFPEASDNTLMPLGNVEAAQIREVEIFPSDRKTIGVDVARFGSDSTVITAMHGRKQTHRIELYQRDALEVSGAVINLSKDIGGADIIVVDETGVGGGVVDLLMNESKNRGGPLRSTEIRGVQFGAACESEADKEKFVNLKARMFSLLSDDLKTSAGISLLNDSIYLEELPSILYKYDQKGRLAIESKDDYKKRTGRKSPDNSDSLALANYGRYDELTIGKFSSDYYNVSDSRPLAGSLKSNRTW